VLLTFSSAVAFADCINESYPMKFPSRAEIAKLKDGDHSLATVKTSHGTLEARTVVKAGKAGEIVIYHEGQPLKDVQLKDLPQSSQSCAKQDQKGAAGDGDEGVMSAALSWLVPTVEAKFRCNGSGTVIIKLVECWTGSDGVKRCSFRYIQAGQTCGYAICPIAP